MVVVVWTAPLRVHHAEQREVRPRRGGGGAESEGSRHRDEVRYVCIWQV